MRANIRISSFVPSGLAIESVCDSSDSIILAVRSQSGMAECPLCGARSRRIHSRYNRQVADLPCAGKQIRLRVITRRFVCEVPHCRRRIFAERFGDDVLPSRSRRTARLECIVHHLGLALGGRPAATFARRLLLPVSNDTLLRVVRRRTAPRTDLLTVVGVDDWAFRRNRRYGTIVCDLERRRIVTLLPDREPATVRAWLANHPGIKIVSRDRGGGYGEAAAKALPDAVQVADRWHLMENASAAFLDAVRKSMRAIRSAIGSTTITPQLLTSAEKLRYESYLRREDTNTAIVALAKNGISIKQIVRRLGHSRNLVRQTLRGGRTDVFQTRQRSLDAYYLFLERQWSNGCRNGAELWRRLQARGFQGSLRSVGEWTTRRRRSETVSKQQLQSVPSARAIARLMTIKRDGMTKADAVVIAAIEAGVPSLVEARALVDQFHDMIRRKDEAKLDAWIANAKASLVASLARGVLKDRAAVRAAITQSWSNGQVEAQITKLKLVKRQMYGRAKIDLLEARLLGAA
jgi:transposase